MIFGFPSLSNLSFCNSLKLGIFGKKVIRKGKKKEKEREIDMTQSLCVYGWSDKVLHKLIIF